MRMSLRQTVCVSSKCSRCIYRSLQCFRRRIRASLAGFGSCPRSALVPFLDGVRTIAEHRFAEGGAHSHTRSHHNSAVLSAIFAPFFQYHWEHHLFPSIPAFPTEPFPYGPHRARLSASKTRALGLPWRSPIRLEMTQSCGICGALVTRPSYPATCATESMERPGRARSCVARAAACRSSRRC